MAKAVYEASDGTTFDNKKEADRHDEVIASNKALDEATTRVKRALLANALTADGQPIVPSSMRDYYCITRSLICLPRLMTFRVYHNCDVDVDKGVLTIRHYDHDRRQYVSWDANELYADYVKATEALVQACEDRISEMTTDLANLRKQISEGRRLC